MNPYRSIILMAIALFIFSVPAWAADETKIGIVDFQEVMNQSEAGKAMQAKIQSTGKGMEEKLKKLGNEIVELEKTLKNNIQTKNLSESKVEELQREMGNKETDFRIMQKKFQGEMQELQNKYLKQIQKEIFEIAGEIGKKDGYLIIIEKTAVIYNPDTIDITAAVTKIYNDQFDGKL